MIKAGGANEKGPVFYRPFREGKKVFLTLALAFIIRISKDFEENIWIG